jgi:hypothetical protein
LIVETYWDANIFGVSTCEIKQEDNSEYRLKKEIDSALENYTLVYSRVLVGDTFAKICFSQAGFIPCEVSCIVTLSKLRKQTFKLKPLKAHVSKAEQKDIPTIVTNSRGMYSFSRFHESPFVEQSLSCNRMQVWVEDLLNKQVPCLVLKSVKSQSLLGYMFYTIQGTKAELLLGGCTNGNSLYATTLWLEVLSYLKGEGVNKVTARISAANDGVVRLYSQFGFEFGEVSIDFQKRVNNGKVY